MTVRCKFCNFSSFHPISIISHLKNHPGLDFICGVYNCPKVYSNISSFKAHLYRNHDYFYPKIIGSPPDLTGSNVFTYDLLVSTDDSITTNNFTQDDSCSFSITSPTQDTLNISHLSDSDNLFHENSKKFMKILLDNGFKYNVPFECIKNMSQSFLSLISELKNNNHLEDSLIHNFNTIVSSTDRFDQFLDKYFEFDPPEIINIRDTGKSFIIFSFKKSLQFLLSKIKVPSNILYTPPTVLQEENKNFKSFFDSEGIIDSETIYLNFFIDDFQAANPLLSKKSLQHSLTGIYFRILTKDRFNYAKYENIHLLSLIQSNLFNKYSSEILEYICRDINNFLTNQTLFYICDQPYYLSLKIGYFSCDSLAAANLLGFKKSFNHTYCCRFCLCPKQDFSKIFCEKKR